MTAIAQAVEAIRREQREALRNHASPRLTLAASLDLLDAVEVLAGALAAYQAIDDGLARLTAGFAATPDTVNERGLARRALARAAAVLSGAGDRT